MIKRKPGLSSDIPYKHFLMNFLIMPILLCGCEHYASQKIILYPQNAGRVESSLKAKLSSEEVKAAIQIVDEIFKDYELVETEDSGGYWIKLYSNPFEIGGATTLQCYLVEENGLFYVRFIEWYVFRSSEIVLEIRDAIYQSLMAKFGNQRIRIELQTG